MKILITTDVYSPNVNGIVASVESLKKGLEDQGHEVRVLTLSNDHHSYVKANVYYIGSVSVGKIYPGIRLSFRLPSFIFFDIVAWKPDIVHSQTEFSTLRYAKRIANACGANRVHTYHTVYEEYIQYICPFVKIGQFLVSKITRKVLNSFDMVVAPSDKAKRLLRHYKVNTQIEVIPSGIDYKSFSNTPSIQWKNTKNAELGLNDNCLRLVYVGRLAREKNVEELLKMLANCKDLSVELLIVGDGPARSSLEQKCKRLGISDRVIFTGMINHSDVHNYYHLGDVFVNASTSEAQGITYIEAMASGLPMLCRSDDCLKTLIKEGITGWQYQNESQFKSIIEILISDSNLRNRISTSARAIAKDYSYTHFVERIDKIYSYQINPLI